jgi:hypothetical protein
VRIEALALGRVGLDADARQRAEQLALHEADAVGQVVVAVLGLGLGRRQGALEVVQRRQQLAGELEDAARLGGADVAARALAHVVELGDGAQPLVLVVGLLGSGLLGDGRLGDGLARARAPAPRTRAARRPVSSTAGD